MPVFRIYNKVSQTTSSPHEDLQSDRKVVEFVQVPQMEKPSSNERSEYATAVHVKAPASARKDEDLEMSFIQVRALSIYVSMVIPFVSPLSKYIVMGLYELESILKKMCEKRYWLNGINQSKTITKRFVLFYNPCRNLLTGM